MPDPTLGRTVLVCQVCGAARLDTVLDMGYQPAAEDYRAEPKRYPLRLMECRNCGLVQLSHIIPQVKMFPPDHPYATGNSSFLRHHFRELAGVVWQMVEPGDLVVDIGANDGTFLRALRSLERHEGPSTAPLRLLGVEPTNQAAKISQGNYIDVDKSFFTQKRGNDILRDSGPASVIVCTNVLAHVPEPHDFMAGVQSLLAADGTFITENHHLLSVTNLLQIDTIYHEHLRYYTPATLGLLLARHGLEIAAVERVPTHGGSFRTTAKRRAVHFQARAHALAQGLESLLSKLDGPVYGVGAATRATPLMHFARIARFLDRVVEVPGSEKIGRVMPGTLIPITDENDLILNQPPYALLFSWHMAGDIAPKLRAAGYKGKFIVPLPTPRIMG